MRRIPYDNTDCRPRPRIITVGTTATPAGSSFAISGFEISGVAIPARLGDNGAAIRWQAGNLTLSDDYFHNNQEGLLGTPLGGTPTHAVGNLRINASEFAANGSNGTTDNL